jgi:hypothetical protein
MLWDRQRRRLPSSYLPRCCGEKMIYKMKRPLQRERPFRWRRAYPATSVKGNWPVASVGQTAMYKDRDGGAAYNLIGDAAKKQAR